MIANDRTRELLYRNLQEVFGEGDATRRKHLSIARPLFPQRKCTFFDASEGLPDVPANSEIRRECADKTRRADCPGDTDDSPVIPAAQTPFVRKRRCGECDQ